MKAGRLRRLMAVIPMLLVAGCFGPQGPMFGDGHTVPEEASRTHLPVRPGPDGTWALNAPEFQLLGQGRVLAHLKTPQTGAWRITLPDELRLESGTFGRPHSVTLEGQVLVLGDRDGHRGSRALAGIDAWDGRLVWRREVPSGSRVFLSKGNVLAASCRPGSCRVTAWEGALGERHWTRTIRGAVRVLDPCGADSFGGDVPRPLSGYHSPSEQCAPFVITRDRVGVLNPENGKLGWVAGLHPPKGTVDRITQDGDRTIMITAPAEHSCRVTVLASGVDSEDGDRGWQHTFAWDQPQAPRDPRTGCRWDRSLPLTFDFRTVLPEAKGALLINPYFGTLRPAQRLARGEYLMSQQPLQQPDVPQHPVIRASGHPDRLLTVSPSGRVRPHGLSPAALALPGGFWQDGRRLVLLGDKDKVLWNGRSACQAYFYRGNLAYCDGSDLVTLQPSDED